MTTKAETVLLALLAALAPLASETRTVSRNVDDDQEIPADGLVGLFDGEAGEPEELLGGSGPYFYRHVAVIELLIAHEDPATRDSRFDALKAAVGAALAVDETLGGAIEGMIYFPPAAPVERGEGLPGVKAGAMDVELQYLSLTRI